jgi:hypothetical protein
MVLLWIGAGALLWVGASYGAFALGLIPASAVGVGQDVQSVRAASALLAAIAAALCAAHVVAAIGLLTGWRWGRPFATLVCVVWALTCVGLPVALLAINSLWRPGRPLRRLP